MTQIMALEPGKLLGAVKEELKKREEIKPHPASIFTKAGLSNERPPTQPDFWFIRSAALLRKLYVADGPVGVERLRTAFGGRKRMGHAGAHHRKSGGKYIRLMLQQLEAAGFVAKTEKPKKGRVLTPAGRKFLDGVAKGLK